MRTTLLALAIALPCSTLTAQTPVPASSGSSVAQADAPTLRPRTKGRSYVLDLEDLRSLDNGSTALAAVRRLRPEYLARHAPPRPGELNESGFATVYLDGARLGGPETLETIPVSVIYRIRYLRASEAAAWVGREHRGGVIAVTTIR